MASGQQLWASSGFTSQLSGSLFSDFSRWTWARVSIYECSPKNYLPAESSLPISPCLLYFILWHAINTLAQTADGNKINFCFKVSQLSYLTVWHTTWVQGCQTVYFQTKNTNLGNFLGTCNWRCWNFFAAWYMLWLFGIFFQGLVWCTKKNLPTLRRYAVITLTLLRTGETQTDLEHDLGRRTKVPSYQFGTNMPKFLPKCETVEPSI
jgi:hypothetical protein